MSENKLDVAMRYKIGEADSTKEAQEIVKPFSSDSCEEYFYYDNLGKFNFSYINGEVFLDYYIVDSGETYDIDITIDDSTADEIEIDFIGIFGEKGNEELNLLIMKYDDISIRFLQYYNGGCSGLSEVR